jgi:hypothetical protein
LGFPSASHFFGRDENIEKYRNTEIKKSVFHINIRNLLGANKEKANSSCANLLATQLPQIRTSKSTGSHFSSKDNGSGKELALSVSHAQVSEVKNQ